MNRKLAFEDIPAELLLLHEKIDILISRVSNNEKSELEPDEFMSVKMVAIHVGVSESTVRRWIKEGRLQHSQPDRRVIVRRKDLVDFLERSSRRSSEDYRSAIDDFYSA